MNSPKNENIENNAELAENSVEAEKEAKMAKLEEAAAYFRKRNEKAKAEVAEKAKAKEAEKAQVGYKNPPKEHQFKKGQSGNPKGRKKKPIPESLFEALTVAAHELADVYDPVSETYSKVRKLDLLASRTVDDALKKDGPSRKFILENLCKYNFVVGLESLIDRANPKEEMDPKVEQRLRQILQDLAIEVSQKIEEEENEAG